MIVKYHTNQKNIFSSKFTIGYMGGFLGFYTTKKLEYPYRYEDNPLCIAFYSKKVIQTRRYQYDILYKTEFTEIYIEREKLKEILKNHI